MTTEKRKERRREKGSRAITTAPLKVIPATRSSQERLTPKVPWQSIQGWFSAPDVALYRSALRQAYRLGSYAEIGVWKGRSFLSALPHAIGYGYHHAYAIDSWQGSPGERDGEHAEAAMIDLRAVFRANLYAYRLGEYVTVLTGWSVEAASLFSDASLDLVFIDGDHDAEAVLADVRAWLPKVRPGGILLGHDAWWSSVQAGLAAAGLDYRVPDRKRSSIWWHDVPAAGDDDPQPPPPRAA